METIESLTKKVKILQDSLLQTTETVSKLGIAQKMTLENLQSVHAQLHVLNDEVIALRKERR
jgi:hypothetical protein